MNGNGLLSGSRRRLGFGSDAQVGVEVEDAVSNGEYGYDSIKMLGYCLLRAQDWDMLLQKKLLPRSWWPVLSDLYFYPMVLLNFLWRTLVHE